MNAAHMSPFALWSRTISIAFYFFKNHKIRYNLLSLKYILIFLYILHHTVYMFHVENSTSVFLRRKIKVLSKRLK